MVPQVLLSRRRRWFGGLFLTMLFASGAVMAATSMTLTEAIARHVNARGPVNPTLTLEREGKLTFPGSNFSLSAHEWKGQGRNRSEMSMQGLTEIQSFDGQKGFKVEPFEGRKDPAALSEDEIKSMQVDADLEWSFVNAAAKGHQLEWLGEDDVDGGQAYGIRVRLANGNEQTFWLDADTFMVIRIIDVQHIRGVDYVQETDYTDYEKIGDVYVPMTESQGRKGAKASQKSTISYHTARWRSEVDAGLYQRTTGATP